MNAARKLCKQMGIKVKPTNKTCGPMETHAINIIAHLIERHGLDNMVLTLRIITETNQANRSQLNRHVITSVNDICRIRRLTDLGLALVEAFDQIDLGAMNTWAKAERLSVIYKVRTVLTCRIIGALDRILGLSAAAPPVPKPSRAVAVPDRLALGLGLLNLKATAGKAFKRAAYDRFRVDAHSAVAYRSMAAAALYASRPEISSRVCWGVLAALSSPSMPAPVRADLERRIAAGESIGAPQIRRARQAHAGRQAGPCRKVGINPSRPPVRPAVKMAVAA